LENSVEILRTVDKISKVGIDETKQTLTGIAGEANGQKILEYIGVGTAEKETSFEQALNRITELSGGPSPESERLSLLHKFMCDAFFGATDVGGAFSLDPSITRGLDYYTGVVFETFLTELPEIGSICSGGRYDNLAGLYTKNAISGVGSSIGLDRMIAALESLDKLPPAKGFAAVAIACPRRENAGLYQALATQFRRAGIPCEVFTDTDEAANADSSKNLVKQFVLAEKKGHQWMIISGERPLRDLLTLRNLVTRQNREGLSTENIISIITTSPSRV
jgi:histidyl-tRNA synthetase